MQATSILEHPLERFERSSAIASAIDLVRDPRFEQKQDQVITRRHQEFDLAQSTCGRAQQNRAPTIVYWGNEQHPFA